MQNGAKMWITMAYYYYYYYITPFHFRAHARARKKKKTRKNRDRGQAGKVMDNLSGLAAAGAPTPGGLRSALRKRSRKAPNESAIRCHAIPRVLRLRSSKSRRHSLKNSRYQTRYRQNHINRVTRLKSLSHRG